MVTMRRGVVLAVLLGVELCVLHGGCTRGRVAGTPGALRVVAVLPSVISDQPGEQPDEAFLCYSDADCHVVEVRECCPTCYASYLAVNVGAVGCIERYHERNPCLPAEECAEPDCPDGDPEGELAAVCRRHRCVLVEEI